MQTLSNILVINGKKDGFIGQNKIYIGRKNAMYDLSASPLQNPFLIDKDNRDQVIQQFRRYLWDEIQKWLKTSVIRPIVKALLEIVDLSLKGQTVLLVCWCKPSGCHGDVIVSAINWIITNNIGGVLDGY